MPTMPAAQFIGRVSFRCNQAFRELFCSRRRSPQNSQRRPRKAERISLCPVQEVKLLTTTKSAWEKLGSRQLKCQRAPPNGTHNPGRIRSKDRNSFWGQGESGEAASR